MKLASILLIILLISCTSNQEASENTQSTPEVETITPPFRITKKYKESDLQYMDSSELRISRNEIFAQYGYKFRSAELNSHFNSKDWYKPQYANVDTLLTELDKANIQLISKFESRLIWTNQIAQITCSEIRSAIDVYSFKASIKQAVDSLDKPFHSYNDWEGTCPHGQMHIWNKFSEYYKIGILGDIYQEEIDFNAKSRVFAIQNTDYDRVNTYASFNGIYLGEQETSVKRKIDCLMESIDFKYSQEAGGSVVDNYFIENQKYQYILRSSDLVLHFSIGTNDRLNYILIGTFEPMFAC